MARPPVARVPGLQRLLAYSSAPVGRLRSHRQMVSAWPAEPAALGPRVALYCHYDPHGAVRPNVLRQLHALRQAGLAVALVSNSGTLQPPALAALRAVCAAVLVRRNVGRDFCAWREAMEHFALPQPDTRLLLLANDSVYGPLLPVAPLLARMRGGGLWGLTDSLQRGYHLQSYFLLAERDVLRSAAWRRFWRSVRPLPAKWLMIGRYEVGLTRRLLRAGFPCRALFPCAEPGGGRRGINPLLERWHELLRAGLPFVKRELLRDNPTGAAGVADWHAMATRAAGPALAAEIAQDLAQHGRRRR